VAGAGFDGAATDPAHESGTDRVAEVADRAAFRGYDTVLNVQGDEPFVEDAALAAALARVHARGDDIGTAAAPLSPEGARDPARVKVVCDGAGRALYFSRAPIPFWRDASPAPDDLYWQHVGIYAFRREALQRWRTLPASGLERAERLEQLRALAGGLHVGVALLPAPTEPGIDTPDDLRRAEARWTATARGPR
jgi:3-deoxy-manno-octulosonate cytidylyltransferase (CMP-KDO synthetase)